MLSAITMIILSIFKIIKKKITANNKNNLDIDRDSNLIDKSSIYFNNFVKGGERNLISVDYIHQ